MYRVSISNSSNRDMHQQGSTSMPTAMAQGLTRMKRQLRDDVTVAIPHKGPKCARTSEVSGRELFGIPSNGQSIVSASYFSNRDSKGDLSGSTSFLSTRMLHMTNAASMERYMLQQMMMAPSTHISTLAGVGTSSLALPSSSLSSGTADAAAMVRQNKQTAIPMNPPMTLERLQQNALWRVTNDALNPTHHHHGATTAPGSHLPQIESYLSAHTHNSFGNTYRSDNRMRSLTLTATQRKLLYPQETTEDINPSGGCCREPSQLSLPTTLWHPSDDTVMNEHQVMLRKQIEVFVATEDDVSTHIRGRNKRLRVGQVGIRCRHCAHYPIMLRPKGSTYFPASTLGLYQAAQNMSSTHIQCGLCPAMPEWLNMEFVRLIPSKKRISGAGREYWAQRAKQLGLVDTENDGIALALRGGTK